MVDFKKKMIQLTDWKTWKAKLAWWRDREGWRQRTGKVRSWLAARKDRLIPVAAFLAASLAVFVCCNLLWLGQNGAVRVARQYMDAAMDYDFKGIYDLFDEEVLVGEMKRFGLDRVGVEVVAEKNSALVSQYVAQVETGYGVEITYRSKVTAQHALAPSALEDLRQRYAADGFSLDILDARQVTAAVSAQLLGEEERTSMLRRLDLTVIRTPAGWSLDRDSMHVFSAFLQEIPVFAQEHFGG